MIELLGGNKMKIDDALNYVSYVVDDSGNGREYGSDVHAIVRDGKYDEYKYPSRIVGWQCGFEPLFVAVHSYLDVEVTDEEAEEMAADYLEEIGWFGARGRTPADYIM